MKKKFFSLSIIFLSFISLSVNYSEIKRNTGCCDVNILSQKKHAIPIKIYIFANSERKDVIQTINKIVPWLINKGHEIYAEKKIVDLIPQLKFSKNIFMEINLALVFGGDGTLMKAASACADYKIPLLGVEFGHLAFISQISPDQLLDTLENFIAGKLKSEDRMMIQAEVIRGKQRIIQMHGLNEIVIHRHSGFHVVAMNISIKGQYLTHLVADGLIVSTPIGSTAYNLSVGGPIVDPHLKALIFSPISPHSLSARSLVLSPESLIEIKIVKAEKPLLSCDGQDHFSLLPKDTVRFTCSPRIVRLVCIDHGSFLKKLEQKFFWANRRADL